MTPSIRLRRLAFTGKEVEPVRIPFEPGVNLIVGGSNAGKSYVLRAINHVLGSQDELDILDQGRAYDTVSLTYNIDGNAPETLSRALKGGDVHLWSGEDPIAPDDAATLNAKHDKDRADNISRYLLAKLGFDPSFLVADDSGTKKNSFSFRNLIPYVLVPETVMISGESPIAARRGSLTTFEKNVLRFLLTGIDDSAVVTVTNSKTLRAERAGQVKLLDDLLEEIDRSLRDFPEPEGLEAQVEKLDQSLGRMGVELESQQSELDKAISERRRVLDEQRDCDARAAEIRLMLHRFGELAQVYDNDFERLAALDEDGFLLQRFADQPCPLCGADPTHQHHHLDAGAVELQRQAASSEMKKIARDRDELKLTVASLDAEARGLEARSAALGKVLAGLTSDINRLRPLEADGRQRHQLLLAERERAKRGADLQARYASLQERKSRLDRAKVKKQKAEGLLIGIDDRSQFELNETVKAVLEAWRYPNVKAVAFDPKRQDIIVNGRARRNNGKGVMAILHSAFKVAILLYCKNNGVPHPGFLVLDSPLLSYRPPIMNRKHGELSADERSMRTTPLNEAFYEHLISIGEFVQVTILENSDPPPSAIGRIAMTTYAGENGQGRQGIFPNSPSSGDAAEAGG